MEQEHDIRKVEQMSWDVMVCSEQKKESVREESVLKEGNYGWITSNGCTPPFLPLFFLCRLLALSPSHTYELAIYISLSL